MLRRQFVKNLGNLALAIQSGGVEALASVGKNVVVSTQGSTPFMNLLTSVLDFHNNLSRLKLGAGSAKQVLDNKETLLAAQVRLQELVKGNDCGQDADLIIQKTFEESGGEGKFEDDPIWKKSIGVYKDYIQKALNFLSLSPPILRQKIIEDAQRGLEFWDDSPKEIGNGPEDFQPDSKVSLEGSVSTTSHIDFQKLEELLAHDEVIITSSKTTKAIIINAPENLIQKIATALCPLELFVTHEILVVNPPYILKSLVVPEDLRARH